MHKGCAYRNEATWRRFWRKRKSTAGIFATVRFFSCTWKISSVGKDQFNNCEFVYWKLGPLYVFVVIQRMFSSWVRQRTVRFLFKDGRSFYFHSLTKSNFLVTKGLLCLYDKQKIHVCLSIWNFSYCVQLDISSQKNLSSTRRKSPTTFSCRFSFSAGL